MMKDDIIHMMNDDGDALNVKDRGLFLVLIRTQNHKTRQKH